MGERSCFHFKQDSQGESQQEANIQLFMEEEVKGSQVDKQKSIPGWRKSEFKDLGAELFLSC